MARRIDFDLVAERRFGLRNREVAKLLLDRAARVGIAAFEASL